MTNERKTAFSYFKRLSLLFIFIALACSLSVFLKDSFETTRAAAVKDDLSEFSRADLTQQALFYIQHNYYDPNRLNTKLMLKNGLLAVARSVPEILVDFPDNSQKVTISIEDLEQKFTIPSLQSGLDSMIPVLQQIYAFIEKNYKGDVELPDIERAAINGMLEVLDPHSSLLPPKIFKEFKTQTEGEFGGVGIVIGLREADLTVISPIEGTPAWKAGIKVKDKIVKIGNEATINMNLNEAVEKLRGKIGTQVNLTLSREGVADPFEVTLTRAKIKIDSIQSKLLTAPEGDTGYIKVKHFQEDTYRELARNLKKIKSESKNFKGLILDFRNNPGGLLNQAIQVSDLFLEKGVIVSTVGVGDKVRETEEAKALGTEENYPIMILANESSASASEIVAGALKNNNRGVMIGQQTFGKGSVQSVYNLRDGSALKLTIAQYLTPGNESIQTVGITPDVDLIAATVLPNNVHILASDGMREKDLEKHLESTLNQHKKPVYEVRYFLPKKVKPAGDKDKDKERDFEDDLNEYSNDLKLDDDFYVTMARKIILSNPPAERKAALKEAEKTIKTAEKEEDQKISTALLAIGVNWVQGVSKESPAAEVSFVIEGKQPKDPLIAGEEAKLTLKLKNKGPGDFYRLIAKTESENILFKNKEFPFGYVKSGEQKTWTTKIKIPESALSREDEVKFVFNEGNNKTPEPFVINLVVQPKPHPSFAYSYQISGNGNIHKGEKTTLKVTVKNLGPGQAKDTVVNIKNLEGEGVLVTEGRNKLGIIESGASKEATLSFNVDKSFSKKQVGFDFSIADGAVQESLSDKLKFDLVSGKHSPIPNVLQEAPSIQLTMNESIYSTSQSRFNISGVANSETPLKDVLIFVNNNKVYLKPAKSTESLKKLSFASNVPLENNKNNLITIVARNNRDLAVYKSFFIRKK